MTMQNTASKIRNRLYNAYYKVLNALNVLFNSSRSGLKSNSLLQDIYCTSSYMMTQEGVIVKIND